MDNNRSLPIIELYDTIRDYCNVRTERAREISEGRDDGQLGELVDSYANQVADLLSVQADTDLAYFPVEPRTDFQIVDYATMVSIIADAGQKNVPYRNWEDTVALGSWAGNSASLIAAMFGEEYRIQSGEQLRRAMLSWADMRREQHVWMSFMLSGLAALEAEDVIQTEFLGRSDHADGYLDDRYKVTHSTDFDDIDRCNIVLGAQELRHWLSNKANLGAVVADICLGKETASVVEPLDVVVSLHYGRYREPREVWDGEAEKAVIGNYIQDQYVRAYS